MSRFCETLKFAIIIAVAIQVTRVSCSATVIQTKSYNEVDTDAISTGGDAEILDPNCDCEDGEAMFNKVIRQLIDSRTFKNKEEFLKMFQIRKICGSDEKLYNTECELQCARMKQPGLENLHQVNRRRCRHFGKGRALKGKENSKTINKFRSHHHSHNQAARMVRPENDPETLVCICPRNYFPVCASNGITYGNKCAFDCAKENVDPELTVVTLGEKCKEDDKTFL